ncbi:hypothetical protein EB796_019117 [Bugula neritina]|uniref:Uncharacterized protein n=1 Tax=Bugula neritina TaxID=10212 RepID=A0A7J7J997_BUGNE|nr:hypothetical protein EB796_019117 [Bugula neritina]
MEDLVDLISKIPMQNYKEEKDGVAKIKLKLKPLNDEVEERYASTQTLLENSSLSSHVPKHTDELSLSDSEAKKLQTDLQMKVRLLEKATKVKFTSANSGVLLRHGKTKKFAIPTTLSKQCVADDMWKQMKHSKPPL